MGEIRPPHLGNPEAFFQEVYGHLEHRHDDTAAAVLDIFLDNHHLLYRALLCRVAGRGVDRYGADGGDGRIGGYRRCRRLLERRLGPLLRRAVTAAAAVSNAGRFLVFLVADVGVYYSVRPREGTTA